MTDLVSRTDVRLAPAHPGPAAVREQPPAAPLRPEDDPGAGPVLLGLARAAIASRRVLPTPPDAPGWLDEPGATFVTLTRDGRLRGCIGSVQAFRRLGDDVMRNACSAAFSDPRFPPLPVHEIPNVRIEVSLLSTTEPIPAPSRDELLAHLVPGVDGLILAWHGHRGTFLPQVWEQLPDPHDFVEHLLHKAGLPVVFWSEDVVAHRFGVTAWHEPDELPLART